MPKKVKHASAKSNEATEEHNNMQKIKTKQVANSDTNLDLPYLSSLGGTRSDLDLISSIVDDDDEIVDEAEDDKNSEVSVDEDEIREFILKLGIKDHRPTISEPDDEVITGTDGGDKEDSDDDEDNDDEEEKDDDEVSDERETKPSQSRGSVGRKQTLPGNSVPHTSKVQHCEVSSTTTQKPLDIKQHIIKHKANRNYLLVKTGSIWTQYEQKENTAAASTDHIPDEIATQMESFASKLLQDEVTLYNTHRYNAKKSETTWIKTVLKSGTLGDKMAALILLVQDSPLHNLASLDSLIAMTRKKGRRESLMAIETLKELFLSDVLPTGRKLRSFQQHSLSWLTTASHGDRDSIDQILLLWHFESQLKYKYSEFIKAVETLCFDTLAATKQKALGAAFGLLSGHPEQEKLLLTILVNKVGDPDYTVASKCAYLLCKLVEEHPNMNSIIVGEVEALLYRSNISSKAQYYAICFLNTLVLSHEESELALKLINVYFSFFSTYVKKGNIDNKMMCALLTGVNRAYPYAKVDYDRVSSQMKSLYRIVHMVNFSTGLQALMLLYQVMESDHAVCDHYYMALYKKLLDPAIIRSSKQSMFLNLLFKSIKSDTSDKRSKAFIKRLLQVCLYQAPPFICGSLYMIAELLKVKPGVLVLADLSEDLDDEEEKFVDLPDPDDEDVKEFPALPVKTEQDTSSWVHRQNREVKEYCKEYTPLHRNPLFCRADRECVWELERLAKHCHPTVTVFAKKILSGEPIVYSGNPLQDFTLIKFLDRFVYKNPKQLDGGMQGSVMKPKHKSQSVSGVRSMSVTSDQYIKQSVDQIPVEEQYLYKYFKQRALSSKKSKKDEDSDVSDDEFDEYLERHEGYLDTKEDLDFAGNFAKDVKRKGKKDEDSDDEIDDDNLSDEEVDFDEDEMKQAFGDDEDDYSDDDPPFPGINEEDVEFSHDDFAELEAQPSKKKRKHGDDAWLKDTPKAKKMHKGDDVTGLFASAEQFSHLLDENAGSQAELGTMNALSNKDNADVKQLRWEAERDRWMRGTDWKSRRRQGRGSKGKGKEPANQKSGRGKGKKK